MARAELSAEGVILTVEEDHSCLRPRAQLAKALIRAIIAYDASFPDKCDPETWSLEKSVRTELENRARISKPKE